MFVYPCRAKIPDTFEVRPIQGNHHRGGLEDECDEILGVEDSFASCSCRWFLRGGGARLSARRGFPAFANSRSACPSTQHLQSPIDAIVRGTFDKRGVLLDHACLGAR
jgi:hypothetical protein